MVCLSCASFRPPRLCAALQCSAVQQAGRQLSCSNWEKTRHSHQTLGDWGLQDLLRASTFVHSQDQEVMCISCPASTLPAGGAGGLHGAPDGSSMQLILATEERLQRSINTLRDALNNQIAELDGAKQKYDTSLELVQVRLSTCGTGCVCTCC
jgi:hypothetical protein